LGGTITTGHSLTISGVTIVDGRIAPVNGTHVLGILAGFPNFCGLEGSLKAIFDINFTRDTVYTLPRVTIPQLTVTLPTGVKAVVTISGKVGSGIPGFDPFKSTAAAFHKVLTDVNGYVNCGDSISGFTFNKQESSPASTPVFDAAAATVSYA
jgi:hypothetical protein